MAVARDPIWHGGSLAPLLLACDLGDMADVRRLVAGGADVNLPHLPNRAHGQKSRTAHAAGSPAFNAGVTPLMCACRSGHLEVARTLVEELGADITAQDMERWNALHYACFSGHANVAHLLVSRGCPKNIITKFEKATPEGFARHRRFAAACEACGRLDPPPLLTEDETLAAFTKCEEKRARGERAGAPLLHRYELSPCAWAALKGFLADRGAEDVHLTACDILTQRQVNIRWCSDHPRHIAEVAALRLQGRTVLRASSVAAIQHFAVLPAEDAPEQ